MTNPDRSRSRDWAALVALMLGYIALFLTYYPPLAGIEDEVGFINQTLVWSRGAVSAEGAGYTDLADFGLIKGRHVAMRHPGRSLWRSRSCWPAASARCSCRVWSCTWR